MFKPHAFLLRLCSLWLFEQERGPCSFVPHTLLTHSLHIILRPFVSTLVSPPVYDISVLVTLTLSTVRSFQTRGAFLPWRLLVVFRDAFDGRDWRWFCHEQGMGRGWIYLLDIYCRMAHNKWSDLQQNMIRQMLRMLRNPVWVSTNAHAPRNSPPHLLRNSPASFWPLSSPVWL